MDLIKLGTQLLVSQFQGKVSEQNAFSAISSLLGEGFSVTDIVNKMTSGSGLSDLVGSWLGDGENKAISTSQILEIFGSQKITQFSSTLGIAEDEATSGLSQMLPKLIDKSSSGGNLLESVGDLGGAFNMAKKLF